MSMETDSTVETEVELPEVVTHERPLVADQYRPVLPGRPAARRSFHFTRQTMIRCMYIALISALLTVFALLLNHVRLASANPVDSVQIHQLEEKLHASRLALENAREASEKQQLQAESDQLTQQIRELDLVLRTRYFSLMRKKNIGTNILFGSMICFLLSARAVVVLSPKTPAPKPISNREEEDELHSNLGIRALTGVATVLAGIALAFAAVRNDARPGAGLQAFQDNLLAQQGDGPAVAAFATTEEMAANWPQFRGFDIQGHSSMKDLPDTWDVEGGVNVAWTADVPLGGISSPICWQDKIFVTAADEKARQFLCFDFNTGAQVWSVSPRKSAKKKFEVFEKYVYASSTPACNGRMVFAIFANGDLMACDLNGKVVWEKDMGVPENDYGHASSLVVYQQLLIVAFDHKGATSGIYAFNAATGEQVYKIDRSAYKSTWSTPVIINHQGREQMLIATTPDLAAYDPGSGAFLWKVKCLKGDVGPSPTYAGGLVVMVNDGAPMVAIRPDGTGDVTATHVAWSNKDAIMTNMASMASDGELLWMVSGEGSYLTCLNMADGKVVYEQEMEHNVWASPMLFEDRLLIADTEKDCLFISKERTYKVLSKGTLATGAVATPAIHRGAIVMRDGAKLVCLRKHE